MIDNMIKQLSINNEILDIENILTKDVPHIIEMKTFTSPKKQVISNTQTDL